jgi:hypothetical protein
MPTSLRTCRSRFWLVRISISELICSSILLAGATIGVRLESVSGMYSRPALSSTLELAA